MSTEGAPTPSQSIKRPNGRWRRSDIPPTLDPLVAIHWVAEELPSRCCVLVIGRSIIHHQQMILFSNYFKTLEECYAMTLVSLDDKTATMDFVTWQFAVPRPFCNPLQGHSLLVWRACRHIITDAIKLPARGWSPTVHMAWRCVDRLKGG